MLIKFPELKTKANVIGMSYDDTERQYYPHHILVGAHLYCILPERIVKSLMAQVIDHHLYWDTDKLFHFRIWERDTTKQLAEFQGTQLTIVDDPAIEALMNL